MARPPSQPNLRRPVKTIELIFSVTDAKLWPGPITGGMSGSRLTTFGGSSSVPIGAIGSGLLRFDLRIRVAHRRQVRRARARVELGEQAVISRLAFEIRHATRRVVDVAKDDGFGRAGLLACRFYLAVADLAPFLLGGDLRLLDALHAVGAFLHHAARAHAHVRVALQLQLRRVPI